jgi:tetratricopeptide (TPR) repeat protein
MKDTDIIKALVAEDRTKLAKKLLEWSQADELLRDWPIQSVARKKNPIEGANSLRQSIRKALHIKGFIHYGEARGWEMKANAAIDGIETLIQEGGHAKAIELSEYALSLLPDLVGSIDDSGGELCDLRDRLQGLHFDACRRGKPDVVELARRLYDFERNEDLDLFWGAAERYAEVLGAAGLKEYRTLAEEEWAKVPFRKGPQGRFNTTSYSRITHMMESLAKASANLSELVEVLSRDLSSSYSYAKIALACKDAKRYHEAIEWAEKGMKAFPDERDETLVDLAAQAYAKLGRFDEAMQGIWNQFVKSPGLTSYQALEKHAKVAKRWAMWREKALDEIRRSISEAKRKVLPKKQPAWVEPTPDHSLLVRVFLHEGDTEAAWQEAQTGGCTYNLWLALADARQEKYPGDIAHIYMRHAVREIDLVRNSRYEGAVSWLEKTAETMRRAGRREDFVRALEELRTKYKVKRNLIKLLDARKARLYR